MHGYALSTCHVLNTVAWRAFLPYMLCMTLQNPRQSTYVYACMHARVCVCAWPGLV